MTEEKKPIKVVFAPGSLDHFDGTQEELDDLVAQIQELADSGELAELAQPVDMDDFENDPELNEAMEDVIKALIQSENRTLH
jgi:hypothetical protein